MGTEEKLFYLICGRMISCGFPRLCFNSEVFQALLKWAASLPTAGAPGLSTAPAMGVRSSSPFFSPILRVSHSKTSEWCQSIVAVLYKGLQGLSHCSQVFPFGVRNVHLQQSALICITSFILCDLMPSCCKVQKAVFVSCRNAGVVSPISHMGAQKYIYFSLQIFSYLSL